MTKEQLLTIEGVTLSGADRDTNLIASAAGVTIGEMPITVVAPTNWTCNGLNAQLKGSPVATKIVTLPPPKNWEVRWVIPVTIRVLDQFERPLEMNVWSGVLLWERVEQEPWHGFNANNPTVGTPLNFAASVVDPVQYFIQGWTEGDARLVAAKTVLPWPMGKPVGSASQTLKSRMVLLITSLTMSCSAI